MHVDIDTELIFYETACRRSIDLRKLRPQRNLPIPASEPKEKNRQIITRFDGAGVAPHSSRLCTALCGVISGTPAGEARELWFATVVWSPQSERPRSSTSESVGTSAAGRLWRPMGCGLYEDGALDENMYRGAQLCVLVARRLSPGVIQHLRKVQHATAAATKLIYCRRGTQAQQQRT